MAAGVRREGVSGRAVRRVVRERPRRGRRDARRQAGRRAHGADGGGRRGGVRLRLQRHGGALRDAHERLHRGGLVPLHAPAREGRDVDGRERVRGRRPLVPHASPRQHPQGPHLADLRGNAAYGRFAADHRHRPEHAHERLAPLRADVRALHGGGRGRVAILPRRPAVGTARRQGVRRHVQRRYAVRPRRARPRRKRNRRFALLLPHLRPCADVRRVPAARHSARRHALLEGVAVADRARHVRRRTHALQRHCAAEGVAAAHRPEGSESDQGTLP